MDILRETNIDFMKYRRFWIAFSTVIMVLGLASVFFLDKLNLGIDFAGGTQLTVKFGAAPELERLRSTLGAAQLRDVQIQRFGAVEANEVMIRTPLVEGSEEGNAQNLLAALTSGFAGGVSPDRDLNRIGTATVASMLAASDPAQSRWEDVTPDEWDQRMAVNLKHAFFAIQAVAPGMAAAGGGAVINYGSISWMVMTPDLPIYQTAKAAMHGLTRSMARELGPSGIRVNSLVPGAVMTQRQLDLWISPEAMADIKQHQAIPQAIGPDDCARMALFLAADDSLMVTGQHFLVDAGWACT